MSKVLIFDTTLRDGEQSPGASMSLQQKLEFAKQLEKLKVDIIEAGFPVSSPVQFEACKQIAKQSKKSIIAGLCRSVKGDIDAVYNSLKYAKKPRIHTFISTSDIHIKYKLKKEKKQVLKMAVDAVKYSVELIKDVEFSAEDATRTEYSFLKDIVSAVIDAGAKTINIPDTVGYTTPQEYYDLINKLISEVNASNDIIFSVHCHNDLGMAVANSLSAVKAGARQIECSVNGIGERAGNASLEEVVMGLKTRKDFFNIDTNINIKEIYNTSRKLVSITGLQLAPNKAIVGKNAFSHESGIHQDGVVKNKNTYEIMVPEEIGIPSSTELVLGRHSGKAGFKKKLIDMGVHLTDKQISILFDKFIELADKKKQIFEEDIFALASDLFNIEQTNYQLLYVSSTSGDIPSAVVKLKYNKEEFIDASVGDGPVDATYKAIDKITKVKLKLYEYEIKAITGGKDAMGNVKVVLTNSKNVFFVGQSYSTDIIEGSAKAYLNAVNNYLRKKNKK